MSPSRDQRSLADQGSLLVASALREKHCQHTRRCGCFGRHRMTSWLVLDALTRQGWHLVPPTSPTLASGASTPSASAKDGHDGDDMRRVVPAPPTPPGGA